MTQTLPHHRQHNDEPFYAVERESLFQKLCIKRGWTQDFLNEINVAEHEELKDLDTLTEALHRVRTNDEQIVVLPDFDMDGVTSGTLGWAGLNELGFNAGLYVPDHRRGHDISADAITELREQFPEATTIITCDGGVNSADGVRKAKELGFNIYVTDHHVELPPGSTADITVNPARLDETYANSGICGAFVMYQVIQGYADRYAPHKSGTIGLLKLFAGIGTVSDVMPLQYENRQIVRDSVSLARMLHVNIPAADTATEYLIENTMILTLLSYGDHSREFVSAFEGFALTLKQFRENGKLRSRADLTEEFYGFYLAPAFNAIRRVDAEMAHAFGAFTAATADAKIEHIDAVIAANELRKTLTEEYMEALDQFRQPYAPSLYFTEAPAGMLGLMASKLMHVSNVPTIVLNIHSLSGSARSPFWFPVVSTMTKAGFRAIGHENACGVRVEDIAELEAFVEHFMAKSDELYEQANSTGALDEALSSDMVLGPSSDCDADFDDMDELMEMTEAISNLGPFGKDFPRPEFELVVNLRRCSIKTLGKEETHLKVVLPTGLKLLWWNSAEMLPELRELQESPIPGESVIRLKVVFSLNRFMGNVSVQAMVNAMVPKKPSLMDQALGEFDESYLHS